MYIQQHLGSQDGMLVECWTYDREFASSQQECPENFPLQGFTYADSYLVSLPPLRYCSSMLKSLSFCQKCRWQVTPIHAYTFDPLKREWTDSAVQA